MVHIKHNRHGFSLVILAIIITLAGIMLITMMPSPLQQRVNELNAEKRRMSTIMNALMAYAKSHDGDYPQPARLDLATSHVDFAHEDTAPGSCGAGQIICTGNIKIGALPTKELGLPVRYVFDKWGGKYTYAMDTTGAALTVSSLASTISIEDSEGEEVAIVVLSHGPDNIGAFGRNGSQIVACSRTGANSGAHALSELENCDDDGVFIFNKWSTADATFYDDLAGIIFKAPTASAGVPYIAAAFDENETPDPDECLIIYNEDTNEVIPDTPSCEYNGKGLDFNSDHTWLAMAHDVSAPYFKIYDTSDWSEVSTGAATTGGTTNEVAFSPDDAYLAMTRSASRTLYVFNTSDWTEVDPESNGNGIDADPEGNGAGIEFHGNYMAVAQANSPRLSLYDMDNGWSRDTPGGDAPPGSGKDVAFTPDGTMLAVTHTCGGTPKSCVTVYTDVTPTGVDWSQKVTPTLTNQSGVTVGRGVAFSPDATLLAVGSSGSDPNLTVFRTDTWAAIPIYEEDGITPAELPGGGYAVVFSEDSQILAAGHANAPYITRFQRAGYAFVRKADYDASKWPGADVKALTAAEFEEGGSSSGESTGWHLNF